MSAFVLSQKHINVLTSAWSIYNLKYAYNPQTRKSEDLTPTQVGKILLKQNVCSVNYRYNEKEPVPPFRYDPFGPPYSLVQILKALDCYDYQACETPDYQGTLAASIVNTIRSRIIKMLPGYEEADWEIR